MSQIASRGGYDYPSRGDGIDNRRMNSFHCGPGLQNERGGGRPFGGASNGPSNSYNRSNDSFERNLRVVGVPDVSRFTPRGQIAEKNPVDVVSSNLSANSAWLEAENEMVVSLSSTRAVNPGLVSTPVKINAVVELSGSSSNQSLGFLPRAVAMSNNNVPQQQPMSAVASVDYPIGIIGGGATKLPVTPERSISGFFRNQNDSPNVSTAVKLADGVASPIFGKSSEGASSSIFGSEPYRKQLASLVADVDKRNAAVQHPPLNPFITLPKAVAQLSDEHEKTEELKVINGNLAEVNGAVRLQGDVVKLLSKEQTEAICACMNLFSTSFKQMYDSLQLFSGAFKQLSVASQQVSTVLQKLDD